MKTLWFCERVFSLNANHSHSRSPFHIGNISLELVEWQCLVYFMALACKCLHVLNGYCAGLFGAAGVTTFGIDHHNHYHGAPSGWAYWTSVAGCGSLILLGAITHPCSTDTVQVAPQDNWYQHITHPCPTDTAQEAPQDNWYQHITHPYPTDTAQVAPHQLTPQDIIDQHTGPNISCFITSSKYRPNIAYKARKSINHQNYLL